MLRRWMKALKTRFEPRRIWVSGNALHFSAGGRHCRLSIADIVRIDAYANIEPPSRKFGIVYSGRKTRIVTVEDMDEFLAVFKEIAVNLGLDADRLAEDIALLRASNPIFERQGTMTAAN
ncbi:hypothetical protein [Hyphobacterium sp.]|uniref:hypothetical protein n=1 Tax=Hyphobacterium sp. TaxID=2004662 RepID=UPI003B5269FB